MEQTRRHAFIASLLGIPQVVVAVNKMDLVDFDQGKFNEIDLAFRKFAENLNFNDIMTIPVSALDGDNDLRNTQKTRDKGMSASLFHNAVSRINEQDSDICR